MYSEVLVTAQLCENGIRNGSDTHLEAGSVVNEGCTMLSDSGFHLVRLAEMSRFKRLVSFHEYIYHIHRDHSITPGAWYVRIHHSYYCAGTFDSCKSSID